MSGHEQTVMPSGNQWAKHSGALVSNGSGDWAPIRMNHLSISKPQTTSEVLVARLEESPKCRVGMPLLLSLQAADPHGRTHVPPLSFFAFFDISKPCCVLKHVKRLE